MAQFLCQHISGIENWNDPLVGRTSLSLIKVCDTDLIAMFDGEESVLNPRKRSYPDGGKNVTGKYWHSASAGKVHRQILCNEPRWSLPQCPYTSQIDDYICRSLCLCRAQHIPPVQNRQVSRIECLRVAESNMQALGKSTAHSTSKITCKHILSPEKLYVYSSLSRSVWFNIRRWMQLVPAAA